MGQKIRAISRQIRLRRLVAFNRLYIQSALYWVQYKETTVSSMLFSVVTSLFSYFLSLTHIATPAPPLIVHTPTKEYSEPPLHLSRTNSFQDISESAEQDTDTPQETYSFRHYPAEGAAQRPFATKGYRELKATGLADVSVVEESTVPYAIVERHEGDGRTIIQETDVVAPKPQQSTSQVAETLADSVEEADAHSGDAVVVRDFANQGTRQEANLQVSEERALSVNTSDKGSSERDFTRSGLVHLPPVGNMDTQKRTREWHSKLGSIHPSSTGSAPKDGSSGAKPADRGTKSTGSEVVATTSEQSSEGPKNDSFTIATASSDNSGPMVTMRFEHAEDEDGHHVLIGREGTLTKCEDEVSNFVHQLGLAYNLS